MRIGLINQKGGVGKTTLTLNIAYDLSVVFNTTDILVIDADPQQSALTWSETRKEKPPFSIIGYPKKSLHRDISSLSNNYQHVVIDAPPRMTDITRSCIASCDLILVPCMPGSFDVWASDDTMNLIEEAKIFNPKLDAAFVFNGARMSTTLSKAVHTALNNKSMKLMKSVISERVGFAESTTQGLTLFEYEPKNEGCNEIKQLVKQLVECYA